MAGEQNASGGSSSRMDLNLYLSLPSLRRSQSRDLGSDLTLSSVHLPWSPIAEEAHVSAPYSPSNALSTPDILPADPLHAADNNNPGSEYNPNSSSREPNYAPESQSFDDPYTLPPVHGNEPIIPERSPLVPSQPVPPLQFVRQPSACGVDAQIGYPPPPQLSSRAAHRQVEATLGVYSQIRLSDLTAQGDALSVQQELREHPEYRFQRLIELTNRLWGRNRRPSNDGQRFDSGAHSLTSPERLMHDIVQSQRALEASRKCAEGKEVEYLDKKNEDKSGNAAANFECNICYELAKDPVVTPCGHLFCWFCLYQWLHAHSVNSECPVCKGHVLEINVTPIYGRGGEETKDHKKCGEDGQSGLKIPPRPHANRIESFRQQVRDRLEEGIANSRRNDVDEEVHDGVRIEGYRPSRRQGRFGAARTLATRRMRRIQREEGTGSNSTGLGLLRDPTSGHPLVPSAVFQDGVDLSRPAGSPTSSLNHHSPEPLHQHSHRVEPVMVSDQASASSSVAVIHGDTAGVNPSAGTSAAGPSNSVICKNCKIIPGESLMNLHKLIVLDIYFCLHPLLGEHKLHPICIALFDTENFLNSTYSTTISKVQETQKKSKTFSKSSSTYIVRGLIVNQLFRNSHSGPKKFKKLSSRSFEFPCKLQANYDQRRNTSRNQRTFRPKKSAPSGSKGAQLRKHIDATLGSGNLREAVRLPPGEDLNEWLAVNTVDFFNQVNLLYGTLTEFCTPENCPTMTAGPKYEYRWADGVQIKKPIEVSAPKYVEYLMEWIEVQLDDESIFPQKIGAPFPPNFKEVVKTLFKRLFRVYAHIYHSHFQKIVSLKEEAHLNTCFKHFILFTYEFGLIDKKELAPLQELIESIIVPF
ncbi:unnamed protein product [Musa acuminata subsp. burmannicoides]